MLGVITGIKMLLKIFITLLTVLKKQKEQLTTTQIYRERYYKYAKLLEFIARAIHLHGRSGLTLRGHMEILQESDENQNLGIFFTYLKELQNYCLELKEHLEASQSKSVTYLSSTS